MTVRSYRARPFTTRCTSPCAWRPGPWCIILGLLVHGWPSFAASVLAQGSPKWRVPDANVKLDFSDPKLQPRIVFTDQGFGYEVPLEFAFLKHQTITVTAKLPEPGIFDVVADSPAARIKIEASHPKAGETEVKVHNQLPVMSRADLDKRVAAVVDKLVEPHQAKARQEAEKANPGIMRNLVREMGEKVPQDEDRLRRLYARLRAVQLGDEEIAAGLNEWGSTRSQWVLDSERDAWKDSPTPVRYRALRRLLEFDVADRHLREAEIAVTATARNVDGLLMPKFDGLYALVSGQSVETREGREAVRALTTEELARFRNSLLVSARCRFVPDVDSADANAQWFHGQRVAVSGRGIASVQIEGSLDPSQGDRVDWWQLAGYIPERVKVTLPDQPHMKAELIEDRSRVCLRVTSTSDRPAKYTVLFEPRGGAKGAQVVIHESPAPADVKFPY